MEGDYRVMQPSLDYPWTGGAEYVRRILWSMLSMLEGQ